jgi:hypothetical protein
LPRALPYDRPLPCPPHKTRWAFLVAEVVDVVVVKMEVMVKVVGGDLRA